MCRYINIEDYVSRQTGKPNKEFLETIRLFRWAHSRSLLMWAVLICDSDRRMCLLHGLGGTDCARRWVGDPFLL